MRRFAGLALVALLFASLLPRPTVAQPWVQARTWIIMDADTGYILDARDPHARTATASLTKVMTGLVAVERGDLNQRVTIVKSDLIGEATAGLREGENLSLWTLLHGLLMPSGNDAAMAIARAVGGSPDTDDPGARDRFVGWMNERAASLGLTDTHFVNPHGLDAPGHYSTAYDLAIITRAALEHPHLMEPFGARTWEGENHEYKHGNKLAERYPGVIGGKTGWTNDAGLCLIEVAGRDGRRLVVVLIGSTFERWWDDAADLLDYGFWLPYPATTSESAGDVFDWWQGRTDRPVSDGLVRRSWIWGPEADGPVEVEPYAEAPDGQRMVQYFDKGRMEITYPDAPLLSGWYVTGGRLAWEMITGEHQIGDTLFESRRPAEVPLACDPRADTPTYASLTAHLDDAPLPPGSPVTQRLRPDGSVVDVQGLARYSVTAGEPGGPTNHGIASVFAEFLASRGPLFVDGRIHEGPIFDPPFSVTGYPITEPYWVRAPVAGITRDVLVQCFERRCLTFTPDNAAEWRVEMANIGRHYQEWLEEPAGVQSIVPGPMSGYHLVGLS